MADLFKTPQEPPATARPAAVAPTSLGAQEKHLESSKPNGWGTLLSNDSVSLRICILQWTGPTWHDTSRSLLGLILGWGAVLVI